MVTKLLLKVIKAIIIIIPVYLGGVWRIVMNKYPIKCHVYIISKLYIYNIQKKICFVSCLYVVSVEILNDSKFSRARGS